MDQIEQVRTKTDIVELINSYIPLNKAGRNFKALCPFHSEKTPSFIISPERQIFKCFGCQEGGNVFNFLMKYENMEFGEALRFLADRAGVKLRSFKPSKTFQEKERLLQINHLASEFYHYILLSHKMGEKGLKYLLGRGISKTSIKTFKLGYAPESWENLQDFLVRKKGYQRLDLEKAGLIIKGRQSFYDRFRGRIIFPLFDHRGNTVGFAGRVIPYQGACRPSPAAQAAGGQAKYINTPETLLYHKSDLFYGLNVTKEAVKKKKQAIIVEGELDLISSYQAGVKNIIAIKGSALTENQVNLIKRFTENIALSLDEDVAGDAAARRGIEMADEAGLNIRVIQLSYGKDPDECAQHSAKLWRESVKKAIPIYDFYLKSSLRRFGKKGAESKKKISEELAPILAKISNEVVKAFYVKKLAGVLKVNEEAVVKEIERWEKKQELEQTGKKIKEAAAAKVMVAKKERSRREQLEELLLTHVLQKEKGRKKYLEQIEIEQIKSNPVKRIFEVLKRLIKTRDFKINQLAKKLPEELVETLDRLYLQDLRIDLKDKEKFKREFDKTRHELEKLFFKEKLVNLVEKIRKAEKTGKEKRVKKLRVEFTQVSQRLKELV
jgi:DNA primase